MFANAQFGGMDLGFPDVCKTPIPPIPYPNIALGPMTVPIAFNVLAGGGPWHNLMSVRPLTMGDTPGIGLGLVSQTVMARQQHVTGAFTVIVRGTPSTRVTSIGPANLSNCPLSCRVVPSQLRVLVLAP